MIMSLSKVIIAPVVTFITHYLILENLQPGQRCACPLKDLYRDHTFSILIKTRAFIRSNNLFNALYIPRDFARVISSNIKEPHVLMHYLIIFTLILELLKINSIPSQILLLNLARLICVLFFLQKNKKHTNSYHTFSTYTGPRI